MPRQRDYIKLNGIKYFFHPVIENYVASIKGKILSLIRKKKLKPRDNGIEYKLFCFIDKKT